MFRFLSAVTLEDPGTNIQNSGAAVKRYPIWALEQEEIKMEFLKTLFNSENALTFGVCLLLTGIIYYFSPRFLIKHVEACNTARQALKQEALQLGQRDRFNQLIREEKGISKLPRYSITMMTTGLGIIVAVMIWRFTK